MAQKYRRIDPRIWRDEKFRRLTPDEQRVALYCLTSPQCNRIGLFCFSPAMASEELETLPPTFAKRFGNVSKSLNWEFDSEAKVLYFPTWWKYNRPDNPNVFQACLEDLHDIPGSPLLQRFLDNDRYLPQSYAERLRNVGVNVTGNVTPNHPPQEQEQEQEQDIGSDQKKDSIKRPKSGYTPSVDEVAAYCLERSNGIDPQHFVDYYSARGWMAGKSRMKDWRAAVRTWERNAKERKAGEEPKQEIRYRDPHAKEPQLNSQYGNPFA